MAPNENSTEKNATITVDSLAEKLFIIPDASRSERPLNEYIAELQVHLVDKGDTDFPLGVSAWLACICPFELCPAYS